MENAVKQIKQKYKEALLKLESLNKDLEDIGYMGYKFELIYGKNTFIDAIKSSQSIARAKRKFNKQKEIFIKRKYD